MKRREKEEMPPIELYTVGPMRLERREQEEEQGEIKGER